MPYSGAGVFAVYTPGTPYVTGTTISSTVANNVNNDFATGLSTAITKNGQTTATAIIPFAAGITVPVSVLGNCYSGTWTPTITGVTNVAASTAYLSQYTRVGNIVTGSAKFEIDPTAASLVEFELSLPVASNFANNYECAGSGALATAGTAIFITASVATDRIFCSYTPASAANNSISIAFTYLVI